ncbi:phage protease [Gallaecimonas xiamenensis]|uniref:phage protease n=1 Tax=Gallaecimonas xiamenensis TaxID=1207039 RepID=UPI0004AD27AD|nr:phage protease [Gallaecimonas xiamenensis]
MKKRPLTAAVAALSNQSSTVVLGLAACTLSQQGNASVQLLPDGPFKAKDGRPHDVPGGQWLMDAAAWQMLKADAAERTNDYHFDYEHQTLRTADNGQPAPAAGWINPAALRYEPGQGLFADNVQWTPKAEQMIGEGEYRYISAVFAYDKATGRPQQLLHVALTNNPAVDGMKAIAALTAQTPTPQPPPGDSAMNEALKKLLAALGISIDGVDLNDAEAAQGLVDKALSAIKGMTDQSTSDKQAVADLTAKLESGIDHSQYVPVGVYQELLAKFKDTATHAGTAALTAAIEQAEKDGRIYGAKDRAWLEGVGKNQGLAALTAQLDGRPAIAALTATQTTAKPQHDDKGLAVLTAEDKAVAKLLGITEEDFAKQKGAK